MRLGFGEILIILVIALLVFGPTKLPQLGDALGKGIRNFKKATTQDDSLDVTPAPAEQARIAQGAPAAQQAAAQGSHTA